MTSRLALFGVATALALSAWVPAASAAGPTTPQDGTVTVIPSCQLPRNPAMWGFIFLGVAPDVEPARYVYGLDPAVYRSLIPTPPIGPFSDGSTVGPIEVAVADDATQVTGYAYWLADGGNRLGGGELSFDFRSCATPPQERQPVLGPAVSIPRCQDCVSRSPTTVQGHLPDSGSDTVPIVALACVLVLIGGALYVLEKLSKRPC